MTNTPMTATTLDALAVRVEGLAGPCRETDDAIATALFDDPQRACLKGLTEEETNLWLYRYPNGSVGSALGFTRSLDAAMTLVPEGLSWTLGQNVHHKHWLASVNYLDEEGAPACKGDGFSRATPALALLAAALRARSKESSNGR